MNTSIPSRTSRTNAGIEGALATLATLPFLLATAGTPAGGPPAWRIIAAAVASLACLGASLLLFRRILPAKILGYAAIAGCGIAGFPYLATDPRIALFGGVALIQAGYFLMEVRLRQHREFARSPHDRSLERARGALWTVPPIALAGLLLDPVSHALTEGAVAAAILISQGMVARWAVRRRTPASPPAWILLPVVAAIAGIAAFFNGQTLPSALSASLLTLAVLPRTRSPLAYQEHWWEVFLNHPARVLISTFLGLCMFGTLLLQLPWASARGDIALVDAAFTSVSAVCVTGLTVLDTPNDFTLLGQLFILILIQLGGFGIMTISTVALHVIGKRMSLRQERLLTTLTETNRSDLIGSLLLIVRFTLVTEFFGAALLTVCFLAAGEPLQPALWKGVFTAISAFCNAGFALQSTNLVPYQDSPVLLHTVAALIILGGLAPATCMMLPDWLRGRAIALAPRIALVTSAALLFTGMLFFLVFEWSGTLASLSFAGKLHNAWFQSVTLRTAGFNSVDISNVLGSTLLIMLALMFIGGSPGGTAGGVKTTTIGVLAMTFWASITGRDEVVVGNRRIPQNTINRAITVVGSGALVWFTALLALQITQQLPVRELAFEVTSALGTVGLSLGATPHLDGIGKIVIILTMFIGRVGPMTLFTLLSLEIAPAGPRCPDARIPLN